MNTATASGKSMDDIVALCKRRGFIFPASELYGGINGFWDYGPLGVALKNNLRDAWWHDVVECPPLGPDGHPLEIVGLDSAIIQNPRVWEASGHVAGFSDPMVDDRETKGRFRADQLQGIYLREEGTHEAKLTHTVVADSPDEAILLIQSDAKLRKCLGIRSFQAGISELPGGGHGIAVDIGRGRQDGAIQPISLSELKESYAEIPSPFTGKRGSLTPPREFNLMFASHAGAVKDEANKVYLRPETAQGIFLNYKNVLDTMRVKVPFGIAQIGKAFRNEVTPRNFIYRSREFEQMEMEWFCHPDEAPQWFDFWQTERMRWWRSIGLTDENLRIRPHDADELSHYAKGGCGTVDVEYRFPFTWPKFAELEGIAHRTDFDLRAHQEHAGTKLEYFDQQRQARYIPHVVEPAAGLSRGVLAVICEAYMPDPDRPSKVYLKFHPRLAPIQAAVFPLVAKDGMPEVAEKLYRDLRDRFACQLDLKQSIGKRYARMDESGTPFCFTIDGQTLEDQTVTVRHRDTCDQERIGLDGVAGFLAERIGGS